MSLALVANIVVLAVLLAQGRNAPGAGGGTVRRGGGPAMTAPCTPAGAPNCTPLGAVNNWFRLVTAAGTDAAGNPDVASPNRPTPTDIANTFCADALLLGTVSGTIRSGRAAIAQYFDYFALKPCLYISADGTTTGADVTAPTTPVVGDTSVFADATSMYVKQVTPDVFVYNAMVPWTGGECADRNPETGAYGVTNARMTFILRKGGADHGHGYCIDELHSSFKAWVGTWLEGGPPRGLKCAGGEQQCPPDTEGACATQAARCTDDAGGCPGFPGTGASGVVNYTPGSNLAAGECRRAPVLDGRADEDKWVVSTFYPRLEGTR